VVAGKALKHLTMRTKKPKQTITENQVLYSIMEYLQARKIYAFRINNTPIFSPRDGRFRRKGKWEKYGVADILGIYKGRMLAIEVKRPGGKPTEHQIIFINQVNQNGGIAFVASSLEDVENNLKSL